MTRFVRLTSFLLTLFWVGTLPSVGTVGEVAPPFAASLEAKSRCRVAIETLQPTQFAVGYAEVEMRAKSIAKKTPAELKAYLDDHLAKIVIGPGGKPYLIDGHHLSLALPKARKGEMLEVEVVANWRELNQDEFWKKMREQGWVYLYDKNGRGPFRPEALPKKVTELADDPYRSLAWMVRKRGGYEKTITPFAEFQWANYFRGRIPLSGKNANIKRAAKAALTISRSPDAKHLPGYKPYSGI